MFATVIMNVIVIKDGNKYVSVQTTYSLQQLFPTYGMGAAPYRAHMTHRRLY